MRNRNSNGIITATLVAGTEVVLIGLDIDAAHVEGLLGFSIWRKQAGGGEFQPLSGGRRFRAVAPPARGGTPLSEAPVQDFLWGDYVVDPGVEYVYRIAAAYGHPGAIDHRHALEVAVRTEDPDDGQHGIYFNRGVAASQGYMRRFGEHARWYRGEQYGQPAWNRFVRPNEVPDAAALTWLSRGLGEAMESFIRRAERVDAADGSPRYSLRAAVYEFTDAKIIRAFVDALESGADVKIIHHAATVSTRRLQRASGAVTTVEYDDPARDPVSYRNSEVKQESVPDSICAAALSAVDGVGVRNEESQRAFETMLIPRKNTTIQHNKFIILLEDGQPTQVWTGSTNITQGGIYGQSNVGQVVRDRDVARKYLDYWTRLAEDPPSAPPQGAAPEAGFANWNALHFPDPEGLPERGTPMVLFSPRPTERALNWYAELFGGARNSVHFTTAFTVAEPFLDQAVLPPPEGALRYLLMESVGGRLRAPYERMRQEPRNRIAWGDRVGAIPGSSGQAGMQLEEALTGLNEHVSYMHTKYMLADPLTDDPVVVSGSANFSRASTVSNDENMIVYRGDTRVADIFLSEFMRLFRHFESRNRRNELTPAELAAFEFLREDDGWAVAAFTGGSASRCERLLFAGAHVP
ncbi:MAG: phospholipase D-like domain-containing protein [Pseudomonadota bacterium]|nr:phospholipase D-like domain-containing protein [Pseudomonadota bacterium]